MTRQAHHRTVPTYRLYRERTGESGDFWLHCETIPERTHLHNWEIAVHRHDAFFQIFSLTAGKGELLGTEKARSFAAPCALFIPPRAAHGFRFSREVDGLVVTALSDRLNSVAASDLAIAAYAEETRITPLAPDHPDAALAVESIRRIHAEIAGHAPGRSLLLDAMMTQAIVSLARLGAEADHLASEIATRDRERIEHLETLIGAHFREHQPVGFYAEKIGVSSAHLNRLARALTGASVQELIARRVMEAARRDLVFTPTPIQAIAFSLGFQDPAYFHRFFRKIAGVAPGAFRQAERKRLQAESGDAPGVKEERAVARPVPRIRTF
ncbi:AraC family transcriptional activator of pobA [Mesorhizobium sp. J18]|nr:AraC family transcriptional activator of pobA [Mesorhizobium sp. J18]